MYFVAICRDRADGLEMRRQADSNDLEFRLICFPQLILREPWQHCRFSV